MNNTQQVFQFCEQYRIDNPEFRYWLRVRNDKNRLDEGIWFQGNERYASVGLYNSLSGNQATKGLHYYFLKIIGWVMGVNDLPLGVDGL